MTDERTRKALEKALSDTRPGADRLEARVPAILARAAEGRAAARDAGLLAALVPLAGRALPALGAAAAVLVAAAGISWWQRAQAQADVASAGAVTVSSALFAGYETSVEEDPLAAALVGDPS